MKSRKSRKVTRQTSSRRPTIGFLGAATPEIWHAYVKAFEKRLHELGRKNGSTITIDYRWAKGDPEAYASIARDFVNDGVDIIVTSGTAPTLAAKNATQTIPIVFATAGDPVGTKLVKSLKRPGGNVTGQSNAQTQLAGKRLDQLHKLVPGLQHLAIIGDSGSRNVALEIEQIQKRARKLNIATTVHDAEGRYDVAALIKLCRSSAQAIFVCTDPTRTTHQAIVHKEALGIKLPTVHAFKNYVEMGGLMSYGPDIPAMFRRAAEIVDRILRGTKPTDIPVKVQKKFELAINRTTAKTLGLPIPPAVMRRATIVK
jgi:ABC-type uncharacterized transport system substrate-binding protein